MLSLKIGNGSVLILVFWNINVLKHMLIAYLDKQAYKKSGRTHTKMLAGLSLSGEIWSEASFFLYASLCCFTVLPRLCATVTINYEVNCIWRKVWPLPYACTWTVYEASSLPSEPSAASELTLWIYISRLAWWQLMILDGLAFSLLVSGL